MLEMVFHVEMVLPRSVSSKRPVKMVIVPLNKEELCGIPLIKLDCSQASWKLAQWSVVLIEHWHYPVHIDRSPVLDGFDDRHSIVRFHR